MTAPETSLPLLPDYLHRAPAARMAHHSRVLEWGLPEPGKLHGNEYERAWIEVAERGGWGSGELWLSATRSTGGVGRDAFTARARDRISDEVLAWVRAARFDGLWIEAKMAVAEKESERARDAAREADDEREWWRAKALVLDHLQMGHLIFRPIAPAADRHDGRGPTVTSYEQHGTHRKGWGHVIASAWMQVNGAERPVGWISDHGEVLPLVAGQEDRAS